MLEIKNVMDRIKDETEEKEALLKLFDSTAYANGTKKTLNSTCIEQAGSSNNIVKAGAKISQLCERDSNYTERLKLRVTNYEDDDSEIELLSQKMRATEAQISEAKEVYISEVSKQVQYVMDSVNQENQLKQALCVEAKANVSASLNATVTCNSTNSALLSEYEVEYGDTLKLYVEGYNAFEEKVTSTKDLIAFNEMLIVETTLEAFL